MSKNAITEIRAGLDVIYPRLWRYALVLSKRKDIADDLAQATALRALEKAHQYQVGTKLDAWLFTILSSLWKNQLRANKVRLGAGVQPIEEIELAASAPTQETNIYAGQVLNRVMALPDTQRDTVFLVYIEGYSYKEAAAHLDVPIGTVMSRLATGRKTIQQSMDPDHKPNKGVVS